MSLPDVKPSPYAPMRSRAAPFKDSANWAYIAIALAVLWYGFQILFLFGFGIWSNLPHVLDDPSLIDTFLDGSTVATTGWTLGSFALYSALLWVLIRMFHGKPFSSIVGPTYRTVFEFTRVSLYLLPIYAFLTLPALADPQAIKQFDFGAWLFILPMMLPLLFIQISAEEFVFRGYLQSHMAALARHPIVWMGIPSVLFGLIHYDPTTAEPYSAWSYVVWASFLGLLCADVTARSGTIGPALAIHFVNNFSAILVLSADDWMYGAALYVWPMYGQPWEPWIPFDALLLLCVWLTARLAIRR